jgi:hypothetical protein
LKNYLDLEKLNYCQQALKTQTDSLKPKDTVSRLQKYSNAHQKDKS